MIRELHIRNFALIEHLDLDFEKGLSVFTGETGAGKSILVGAIGLLLGARATPELIGAGAEEARVDAVFDTSPANSELHALLKKLDIPSDDSTLIIRRSIGRTGRSRAYINQIPVTLVALTSIGEQLVDLHGQHEHQSLLRAGSARLFIDSLPAVAPLRAAYLHAYHTWCEAHQALDAHDRTTRALAEKRDMLEFHYRELHELAAHEGEEKQLEEECTLLSSSAQRLTCVAQIQELLADEEGVTSRLGRIRRLCDQLSRHDPAVSSWVRDLEGAVALVGELERFCSSYAARVADADPSRIEQLNARLARLQRYAKKFRCTPDELPAREAAIRRELDAIGNAESDRHALVRACDAAAKELELRGRALQAARERAANEFDPRVTALMEKLGFRGGALQTVRLPSEEAREYGLEELEFRVRTNPGGSFLPLSKCASGGEISRLMLAIKTVLAEQDRIPVLIFDEIDAGIGGMTALAVADALRDLSTTHQVLCISHLHQIAARADAHYRVSKATEGERAVTHVARLDEKDKVDEIARMLGSDSELSRRHAREMLRGRN